MVQTILFVDAALAIGGATRAMFTILSALDRARFRAVVACNAGPVADEARALGCAVTAVPLPLLTFAGGPAAVVRMPVRWGRGSLALSRVLSAERPRAVYANGLAAALYAGPVARRAGLPLVWHVQDVFDDRARMKPFVRLAAAVSTTIPCVSRAAADRVIRLGAPAERCRVVHLSLPRPLAAPAIGIRATEGAPATIVAAGALTPGKGHAVLVEAMATVVRTHPDATAAILGAPLFPGDDAYEARLRERVDALGLSGRVRLLGFRRDAAAILATASIVVHPSTCEESFGLVSLEAMAAGRPVVATRVGALPEVVSDGESGILVPPGDVLALAGAIVTLLDDAPLRERMGAAGRRIVADRFGCERMVAEMNEVFAAATGERPLADA